MSDAARLDELDPFGDVGRREKLRALCTIAGVPGLAEYLFESGTDVPTATRAFARRFGALPPLAPFPDLLADPFPRADD